MKNYYDITLPGHTYTPEEAIEWARGFVFSECETTAQKLGNLDLVNTVDGIEIYFCIFLDTYYFCDEQAPETKKQKLEVATQAVADLMVELENIHYLMENEIDDDEAFDSVVEELDNQAGTINTILTGMREN